MTEKDPLTVADLLEVAGELYNYLASQDYEPNEIALIIAAMQNRDIYGMVDDMIDLHSDQVAEGVAMNPISEGKTGE